ncbi:hypothetical protein SmJEL517_g00953 [Synchytrium microbalum]|uniref:ER membrane protein complex subunit 2 n=1 Tax=Synchytrium microbalum TaxID=1806994 RepID=A0A507C7D5_9FUNG|nr:uncharacterized protein SmJEL517_g00953 [Synchytrium microbalum]TPX36957.1 hypothetical protein SmJEL517_g00953 [Synchytrium microbalum]
MTAVQISQLASFRGIGPDCPMDLQVAGNSSYDLQKIISLSREVLKKSGSSLSEGEKLNIQEQLMIALLETGNVETAFDTYNDIAAKFPAQKSLRTTRLFGMYQEATGDHDAAFKTYKSALDRDETYLPIIRRVVGLMIGRGQRPQAIEQLVKYLDSFMQDAEGWLQISSLYLAENMYAQASFALEELILLRPGNHLYHLRYADVLGTMGNNVLALKHYCRAVELSTDNVRGLYGMRITISKLIAAVKVPGKSRGSDAAEGAPSLETLLDLYKLTEERLQDVYGSSGAKATIFSILKAWFRSSPIVK